MLIHMTFMHVMQMTVMNKVDMTIMKNSSVSTPIPMDMIMIFMMLEGAIRHVKSPLCQAKE